ncbi:hypothetical protein ILUMI_19241 [Ignelater luminosus]|uniref:CHK kinase-like domain-containing protein n=1 Tax=Ignelater luminosus TaxID=2038154 RepID=A0A8K0G3E3_IGNLU|nr:hypothetical protein ILUMI_19241 [Ignelater luminosus]
MGAPEWVSRELLQNALREFFSNKDIQILGYTSSAAVPAGDNYTSDLFRTSITYRTGQNGNRDAISVIIKCSPEAREQMRQLVAEIRMFEIEAEMYMKTLPALQKIIGDTCSLSAKFIYFTKVPYRIIMFEDLAPLGFRMYDRQQGFDLEHCLMVIDKMACQHAASVVLHEKDPVLIADYKVGLYSSNSMIAGWVMTGWDALTQATAKWPGYEKYSCKLKVLREKVITKTVATLERKLGAFHVLNHGDAWVNNFLFSYTPKGKLKDFRFVDYQMVVYSSPAIDLHYFWATSPKMEVRKEHLDTILDRYYAQLLHNLSRFQYSLERVPTRSQFLKDFESKAFYGKQSY